MLTQACSKLTHARIRVSVCSTASTAMLYCYMLTQACSKQHIATLFGYSSAKQSSCIQSKLLYALRVIESGLLYALLPNRRMLESELPYALLPNRRMLESELPYALLPNRRMLESELPYALLQCLLHTPARPEATSV